jgi:excisionase family DNA binding protein
MDERRLLRMAEVAERLGIGRSKAYEMAKRGDLPGAMRVGASLRVSAKALDEWIDREASKSGTTSAA